MSELALLDLVATDLQRVEDKMVSMSRTAFGPLADAFLHLLGGGGKRLRPALALAAYALYREPAREKIVALAAAVETLHNATLVHDDLVDGALMRRGRATLNTAWSKGATVLAGDYLFANAASFAAETENVRVVKLFAETLRTICDGELRQLFSSGQWQQPKESYYDRIYAKTASLFATSSRTGAILAEAPRDMEEALYNYGYQLGMAFQIVDDILDFTGDEALLGKPVGSDLRQGTITLPFFYFLESVPDQKAVVARLQNSGGMHDAVVAEIVAEVRASDAIERAEQEACDFAAKAQSALEPLPRGPYWDALHELADFVVARER